MGINSLEWPKKRQVADGDVVPISGVLSFVDRLSLSLSIQYYKSTRMCVCVCMRKRAELRLDFLRATDF